jgi:hypothetical protein
MVKKVEAYSSYMVESYEKRYGEMAEDVAFKIDIDSCLHYDRGAQVCEILLELL